MKAFASFCWGAEGTPSHDCPWPDSQESSHPAPGPGPHVTPGPVNPCTIEATVGLGSSSPQSCPGRLWLLLSQGKARCITWFGSFTPSAMLYFTVHVHSHFQIMVSRL